MGQFTSKELKVFGNVRLDISEIKYGMLMLRRNEKDFLARKDIKYKVKFEKNISVLQNQVGALTAALSEAGLEKGPAEILSTTLSRFDDSFNSVVSLQQKIGLNPKDGLYGSLRKAVHQAESEIKTLGDQRLRADMLQLRRNEKDFMLRQNLKYLDKFKKNISIFNSDLADSESSPDEKGKLHETMGRYRNRFLDLVKINQEKGLNSNEGLMGKMRTSVHQTETVLDKLNKELNTSIESEIGGLDHLMTTTVLIALVLTIIVAGIIGWIAWGILRPMETLASTMTQAAADNNLSLRVPVSTQDEIGETGLALNSMLDKFQNIVSRVNGSATEMSAAAEKLSMVTRENTTEIHKQNSQTDQVATAITEMSATVQEVARNAGEAAESANETMKQADTGLHVVNAAIQSMDVLAAEIKEASTVITKLEEDGVKIGAVLDVIRGIAEQTNLLALNAAIEAARAGARVCRGCG